MADDEDVACDDVAYEADTIDLEEECKEDIVDIAVGSAKSEISARLPFPTTYPAIRLLPAWTWRHLRRIRLLPLHLARRRDRRHGLRLLLRRLLMLHHRWLRAEPRRSNLGRRLSRRGTIEMRTSAGSGGTVCSHTIRSLTRSVELHVSREARRSRSASTSTARRSEVLRRDLLRLRLWRVVRAVVRGGW